MLDMINLIKESLKTKKHIHQLFLKKSFLNSNKYSLKINYFSAGIHPNDQIPTVLPRTMASEMYKKFVLRKKNVIFSVLNDF